MSITQREIAGELGLSRQIVGQALSGHPRVAAETRSRVQEAALRHGYNFGSNREARALIGRRYGKRVRSGIIVVAFAAEAHGEAVASSPLVMPMLAGIQTRGLQFGYDVLSCSTTSEVLPRIVRDGGVDGVIVYMGGAFLTSASALGLPGVSLARVVPDAPSILPDGAAGIRLATQHLLDLGHRHIAYLGPGDHFEEGARRLGGYTEAMQSASFPLKTVLDPAVHAGPSVKMGQGLAARLGLAPAATGLVCYNDSIAMGVVSALQARGIKVPEAISVTGFDDITASYGFRPTITSIGFDKLRLGAMAVEVLICAIERNYDGSKGSEADSSGDNMTDEAPLIWGESALVVRESTARPPRG